MDDNESDIGEDEMGELNEDDVEEVVFVDGDVEGDDAESDDEDQNQPSRSRDSSSPVRDDSDFVFRKHTGSVYCCALDPKNGNLAVTGGQDDKVYVWEIQQGEILFECQGHKDSITVVAFSYDGTYLATGDMSGFVQVWKVATRTLTWSDSIGDLSDSITVVAFSYDGTYLATGDMSGFVQVWKVATRALTWSDSIGDLSWMQWHHGINALLCAVTTGEVFMWKIPSGECKVIAGHAASTDCGVVMPDGRRVAVGYSDGVVKVFDLKSGSPRGIMSAGEAHSQAVSCMDAYSDNNILATGGEDGKVTLFKTSPLKVVWSFNCAQQDDSNPYVEAVGFSKDASLPLLAAGTLSGNLFILDFANQVIRHRCGQDEGISRLVWDRSGPMLFVGGLEGVVRIYDARSGTVQARLLGHKDSVLDICLSMDGNTLLSVSEDTTCRVYAVSPPER